MEKQVMAQFMQILKNSSNSSSVAVQLLQTLSILIQNIRSEHSICELNADRCFLCLSSLSLGTVVK